MMSSKKLWRKAQKHLSFTAAINLLKLIKYCHHDTDSPESLGPPPRDTQLELSLSTQILMRFPKVLESSRPSNTLDKRIIWVQTISEYQTTSVSQILDVQRRRIQFFPCNLVQFYEKFVRNFVNFQIADKTLLWPMKELSITLVFVMFWYFCRRSRGDLICYRVRKLLIPFLIKYHVFKDLI